MVSNVVRFRISSVFTPDDRVAVFVVAVAIALRDLLFVNDLLDNSTANDERSQADQLYLLRLSIGHLHEMQKTIELGTKTPSVKELLQGLPPARATDLRLVTCQADDQPSWLGNATAYIRNQAFHYGTSKNVKAVAWALRQFQNDDSETEAHIGFGPTFRDLDLQFAGLVAMRHFHKFPENQCDEEKSMKLLMKSVANSTTAAMRLGSHILEDYLQAQPDPLLGLSE